MEDGRKGNTESIEKEARGGKSRGGGKQDTCSGRNTMTGWDTRRKKPGGETEECKLKNVRFGW